MMRTQHERPGRNDPCWCGSGKKYKKCHLPADRAAAKRPKVPRPAVDKRIKSAAEIEGMRRAGAFNGMLMDEVRKLIRPGVSTAEIDDFIYTYTKDHGHQPATLGYRGYPKSCCTSINEVVCHGIPSPDDVLAEGDIINVDMTSIVDGFYGDQSETFMVGEVAPEVRELVLATAQATLLGIDAIRPGRPLSAIGAAVQPYAESRGYSVVREYTGHGVGRDFHEPYSVFHHETREGAGIILEPGMTLTVEPMINMGGWRTELDPGDGWTVRTRDRKLSAQFEHTLLVTPDGSEVLTLTPSQRAAGKRLIVGGVEFD